MGRPSPRELRPRTEEFERRELLSAITDLIAANSIAAGRKAQSAASAAISSQSIAAASNQGPLLNSNNPDFNPINNQALAPTGTLTPRQQRKEQFVAHYVGTYTVGAGVTSDQRIQTFITAAGTANTMLHSDIQLLLVTPKDTSAPVGGVSAIFDRNLNTGEAFGEGTKGISAKQMVFHQQEMGTHVLLPVIPR